MNSQVAVQDGLPITRFLSTSYRHRIRRSACHDLAVRMTSIDLAGVEEHYHHADIILVLSERCCGRLGNVRCACRIVRVSKRRLIAFFFCFLRYEYPARSTRTMNRQRMCPCINACGRQLAVMSALGTYGISRQRRNGCGEL